MKLVMCLKVRNEEDILGDNLRYHAVRGVDEFVVTDNGSTDRTPEILRRWERTGRLRLIEEPATEDFRDLAHGWVTRMARLAATELGADWVLYADADEFWWPVGGDLQQALAQVPDRYGVVIAPRTEFVPRPDGPGSFADRLTAREVRSSLRPKLAHRAEPDVVLHRGAHDVDADREGDVPRAGRPVLRGVRERDPSDDGRLVWAPVWPARVFHFPLRSFEQYRRRVEVMLQGGFDDAARNRLRDHHESGRLPELYAELVHDDEAVAEGVREGRLVVDERLKRLLPHCADPTVAATGEGDAGAGGEADAGAGGATTAAGPPTPEELEGDLDAELADVAYDALRAATRMEQRLIRTRDDLRERLARAEEKAKRAKREGSAGKRARSKQGGRMRAGIAGLIGRSRRQ